MYGLARVHPPAEEDDSKTFNLRKVEMPYFAHRLKGAPIWLHHRKDERVGRVITAVVRDDGQGMDMLFEIDPVDDLPQLFVHDWLKKGILPDVSLGHMSRNSTNLRERRSEYVNLYPYEVSICTQGYRPGTSIYALCDTKGNVIYTKGNSNTTKTMSDTQEKNSAAASSSQDQSSPANPPTDTALLKEFMAQKEYYEQKIKEADERERASKAREEEYKVLFENRRLEREQKLAKVQEYMEQFQKDDPTMEPYRQTFSEFHQSLVNDERCAPITAAISSMADELVAARNRLQAAEKAREELEQLKGFALDSRMERHKRPSPSDEGQVEAIKASKKPMSVVQPPPLFSFLNSRTQFRQTDMPSQSGNIRMEDAKQTPFFIK